MPSFFLCYLELLLQAFPSRRRCCWREMFCILFWVVIASAVPATVVLTLKNPTHDVIHLACSEDSIELLRVNGFWYEELTVSQMVAEGDNEHRIQLYLPQCSDIEVHEKSGHFKSPYHCHSYTTRQIGKMEYLYLLSGSTVTYRFCMKSNETQDVPQVEFFVFNDQIKYLNYISGVGNGRKLSTVRYTLRVATASESAVCSEFTFTAKESSYYFMTGWCKAGITYQYNITTHTRYLDFKDYHENKSCLALTEEHPCDLTVGRQFLSKSEKYCLLAHVIPHRNSREQTSRTTHIRVNARKRQEVVVIPITVIVVGVVGLLVVVVTYCCCCCRKCCRQRPRGRGYTLINV